VSFPFDLHGVTIFDSHIPCHVHAAPLSCSDHAVLKATSQGHSTACHLYFNVGRHEKACEQSAQVRLFPATTWRSTKVVIRSLPI